MDQLLEKYKQYIINQLKNMKIDKKISIGKNYEIIEGYISNIIIAFTTILD